MACNALGFYNSDAIYEEWAEIKLPTRATAGSAGYDFHIPYRLKLAGDTQGDTTVVTGVRCKIEPGWVLECVPKSGLGFKCGMRLANTVGVIDSDYYNSDNEGHIKAKFSMSQPHVFEAGDKFMQGILLPYGITTDDRADGERNGGFGSTGR